MFTDKPPINPAVGPDTTPVPLSPDEVVQFLRNLRQQLPLPAGELARVPRGRRIAHVDAKFIETAIATLGAYAGVQVVLGRTEVDVRQEIDETSRWIAVADELRALLEGVVGTITLRRQRIGVTALQTYKICQQVARDQDSEDLNARIREMRRLNKFGRSRRKASPPLDERVQPKTGAE
ncbi:MAG: hypothetical protein QOJ98_2077 [Acidobacteriota bacterium]|nr:hypothetical protein [Acidobacteriota bacterium]